MHRIEGKLVASLLTVVAIIAAVGAAGAGVGEDAGYVAVKGWPQMPEGYKFGQVSAVAPDGHGEVFVFHRGEHPIIVFGRDGKFRRSFGDGLISSSHGLRFDAEGNVWTTDVGNHTVRKFSHDGKLLMTLGKEGEAAEVPDRFSKPADIAFGPHGEVYVADGYGNSRVVKFDRTGKFLKAWGKKGTADGEFNLVHAIAVDAHGAVYVGDRENNRIQVFDAEGKFRGKWTEFGAPFGLYLDRNHGQFLVADGRAHKCLVLDGHGKVISSWGAQGKDAGQFDLPHSISMDTDGAVYVTEITGQRVQKFARK
jgi:DNA-binding beta-propeller fold protein YncE